MKIQGPTLSYSWILGFLCIMLAFYDFSHGENVNRGKSRDRRLHILGLLCPMLTFSNFISWRKNVKREIQGPTPLYSWFYFHRIGFLGFFLWRRIYRRKSRDRLFHILGFICTALAFYAFPHGERIKDGNPGPTISYHFISSLGFVSLFPRKKVIFLPIVRV